MAIMLNDSLKDIKVRNDQHVLPEDTVMYDSKSFE